MYGTKGARRGATAMALGAALLIAGCSSSDGGGDEPENAAGITQQPKEIDPFWVNPDGNAAQQVAAYEKDGKDAEADQIRKIAEQPTGEWIGPDNPEDEARGYTEAADKAGRTALLVLYNIPHRDCGQYSQGGAADGDAYREWVDGVAAGIGERSATVILEPDAVLHLVDGCTPDEFHEERYDLLKGAIEKLKSLKNTKVYLDAGNAGWGNPDQIFEPLQWAGIDKADGFSVNVSNFYTTEDSVKYGKTLSAKVGNKPFVIDTSRNGNGPYQEGDEGERWCNPPGRALGETPTTKTADPLVDAYVWVKRPGESDGECKGGPKAGEWWPEYALNLAKASK
ncbi:glucanase [Streptomyces sp. NBRC 14336]|uniref:glycoside hydrolase family 6 protein n=1 Tax=Streptomyces sp. NBRC 14336 TaxID=3030992 RepID=UPI0024A17E91|nr:glycoside hydrolase family 6 protein [Streptomyces sp. NBRC 14336]WBO78210.1 glycoside hydrolase family 6 protein [Streptomyces sp. SBE_14.2]GLW45374.1 glucanase [Streptomyces sp. NBRC 14336]